MRIEPCPEVGEWARQVFLDSDSPLYNSDHEHLGGVVSEDDEDPYTPTIGWLWTNVENNKGGRRIIGTAQIGEPQGGTPWHKARQYEQLARWFGVIPDFVITLDAVFMSTASLGTCCALIEHELYHCAQKRDQWGSVVFDRDGRPVWTMRPHDVEEFTGVVRRYGVNAATVSEEFADAIRSGPLFPEVQLSGLCGVCHG